MLENRSSNSLIQSKVRRFVNGTRNPRDLDTIFLWLRFHSLGSSIVKDLGDFVAHAENKNAGMAWNVASLHSTMLESAIPIITKQRPINLEVFRNGILAVFDLHDAASVKRMTGIGQKMARKVLKSALEKLVIFNGEINSYYLSLHEAKILNHFDGIIKPTPAYSDTLLVNEFADCLIKNRLINKNEKNDILHAREYIAIYAIEKMHLCRMIVKNNSPSYLQISTSSGTEIKLSVSCITSIFANGKITKIGTTIFMTDCNAHDFLEKSVLSKILTGDAYFPIEIGSDNKIIEII